MQRIRRWFRQRFLDLRVSSSERNMDDEMRFHLEMEAAELEQSGLSAEEARRRARSTFGNVEQFKEEAREERQYHFVENFVRDTTLAVRQLRRSRGVALFSAALLAVGIGGTVVAFSVINTLYLRPLPYPNANRLMNVRIMGADARCGTNCGRAPNAREVEAMRGLTKLADAVGTIRILSTTFRSPEGAMLLEGAAVNRDLVSVLRLMPSLGRGFTSADYESDAPAVVALTYSGWQQQFASDPSIIGRTVTLDSVSYVVIGVMNADAELGPPLFAFNARRAQYLIPERRTGVDGSFNSVITRLRTEEALPGFRLELDKLVTAISNDGLISVDQDLRASVRPIREALIERYRASFWNLLGAAGAVLLIACLNVFGLYAARLHDRSSELATRVALGASRYRISQQIAIETFVISVIGGFAGLLIGCVGASLLNLMPVDILPFWTRLQVDIRGVALAAALTCGIGSLLGVAALAILAPQQLLAAWRVGSAGGKQSGRVRQVLVASQIALTVSLLGVAGLLGKIVLNAEMRDIGIARHGMMWVLLESPNTANPQVSLALNLRLEERLKGIPGVTAVGMEGYSSAMTLSSASRERVRDRVVTADVPSVVVEGEEPSPAFGTSRLTANAVSTQYFTAMGTRVIEGRAFNDMDHLNAPAVTIVDEPTARRLAPKGTVVGKRIGVSLPEGGRAWMTIVGVVSEVVNNPLVPASMFSPQFYRPLSQVPSKPASAILKVSTAVYPSDNAIRAAMQEVDPAIATARILSTEESIGLRVSTARLSASLLIGAALFSTVLCCLGIYAAVTFVVMSRQREIAIRLALGAGHSEIVRQFMLSAARMVCIGLLLGLIGAVASTRFIKAMLYGAGATSPAVLTAVLGFMLLCGVVAAWIPSRRATRLEPSQLLRSA